MSYNPSSKFFSVISLTTYRGLRYLG